MLLEYDDYCGMTGDEREEARVLPALTAASELVEKLLKRRVARGTYTETKWFDEPRDRMHLAAYPVEEIVSLTGATQRALDKDSGILRFDRCVSGEIVCQYTGGFAEIPAPIRQACAILARAILNGIENDGREVSSERLGDYQTSYATSASADAYSGVSPSLSKAADALLAPFRSAGV